MTSGQKLKCLGLLLQIQAGSGLVALLLPPWCRWLNTHCWPVLGCGFCRKQLVFQAFLEVKLWERSSITQLLLFSCWGSRAAALRGCRQQRSVLTHPIVSRARVLRRFLKAHPWNLGKFGQEIKEEQ